VPATPGSPRIDIWLKRHAPTLLAQALEAGRVPSARDLTQTLAADPALYDYPEDFFGTYTGLGVPSSRDGRLIGVFVADSYTGTEIRDLVVEEMLSDIQGRLMAAKTAVAAIVRVRKRAWRDRGLTVDFDGLCARIQKLGDERLTFSGRRLLVVPIDLGERPPQAVRRKASSAHDNDSR
jgi:hypothetical protein